MAWNKVMPAHPVVAVAGATGVVGREMLKVLAQREFPATKVKALASARSVGSTVEFGDGELVVEEMTPASFEGVDIALFSAGGDSRDPDAVLRAILDEAQRLSREGFDRALFDRLIRSSLGRRTRDLDSFESVCYRMCAYHFDGVDYFSFPEAYASVTPEDVLQFIRQVIRPERAALSIILPNESEESA